MSNIDLIISERATQIGKFLVGRLLPFRQKRMIGPFIYIDHMGPEQLTENEQLDIAVHPHIGLSTLTYLLEGSIFHRDSLGNKVEIKPGEVNWMTAGKGITHSERTPEHLRNQRKQLHGLQIWVALPKDKEDIEPDFYHANADVLPTWKDDSGNDYKLIAGNIKGLTSPVPVYSKMYLIEVNVKTTTSINFSERLYGEAGLYILKGSVIANENSFGEKQLLYTHHADLCDITITTDSSIYIFGGEVFPEERFIDWNFVSSDKEKLVEAKRKWMAGEFPTIDDDHENIPYPVFKKP